MQASDHLQDDMELKDRAKIAHKQRINAERLARLHGPMRDASAMAQLDAQIAEKKQNNSDDREFDLMMKDQADTVERTLAASEEEEKMMKDYSKREVQKSWDSAVKYKSEKKELDKQDKDYRPEVAGPASCVSFAGQDDDFALTNKMKQAAMRASLQEQMAAKAEENLHANDDDMQYHSMMGAVDVIRDEAEQEEEALRKYITQSVRDHNNELAAQLRERKDRAIQEDKRAGEQLFSITNETKEYAYDKSGRIIRKDMFKGYTDAQQRRFLLENQRIIDDKHAKEVGQNNKDYEWSIQQDMQLKSMESAEYEEKLFREQISREHTEILKQQAAEKKERAAAFKRDQQSNNNNAFFEAFGKSAR